MRLYHGSNVKIIEIDLAKSKVGKDFGCGFYLTPDFNVAQNQARRRADVEGGTPVVNSYEFDAKCAAQLKTVVFDCYSVDWAQFVRDNRANRSRVQIHDFDIVVGPIADDDIGMQMRKFNAGRITIDEFMEAIKWKKVTIQYFFATEQAIKLLTKL